jgi:phosphoglycerate dehydrogenase-like enzyme
MLVLALQRRLYSCITAVRAGNWSWKTARSGRRLRGQRFGVVGCGRIGTAVALRAKVFGFRVQFYDPYVPSGYEKAIGLERATTLDELLEISDVVTLHAPLTAETRGMIGKAELERMKPGAFLVNTARGPLVQERALISALNSGRLSGVALDVVENEPAFSPELLADANCLITPHAAFYSEEALHDMRANAARTVLRVLLGGAPVNVVNGVVRARGASAGSTIESDLSRGT